MFPGNNNRITAAILGSQKAGNQEKVSCFLGPFLANAVMKARKEITENAGNLCQMMLYHFNWHWKSWKCATGKTSIRLTCWTGARTELPSVSIGRSGKDKPHWIKKMFPLPPKESFPCPVNGVIHGEIASYAYFHNTCLKHLKPFGWTHIIIAVRNLRSPANKCQ